MRPLPARVRELRRKLLAKPAFGQLPVCGACLRQVQPRDFGREHCKACEADRARAFEEWDREQWELTHPNGSFPLPAEPMFGSDEAARPFLPDDED
jgi:hypothetical protein